MIPDVLRFWGASPTANDGLIWVFCIFFISYLVGSIPFGVLISKLYKLGDIRSTGSGNIGATNVLRTGSKSAAFLTLIMDTAKGSIVVFLAGEFFGITASHFAAFGVFIGHLFSIFLFFKGGKGVATFIGVLLAYNFQLFLLFTFTWLLCALLFKYSSLSAIIALIINLLSTIAFDLNYIYFIIVSFFILIKHFSNIQRLLTGNETKIVLKKKIKF